MQIWLCLRLPELAVQCLPQQRPLPVAVLEQQRIHAVNAAAAMLGLAPGMDPASARALAGEQPLQLLPRDRGAEAQALQDLSCWAYGITPHLYTFRDDCLMLEVAGSLRLFGGLDAILRHCRRGMASRGYSTEIAAAGTPLAAWALSHAPDHRENTETPLEERLAPLPTTLLAPLHGQFDALDRGGLRRLGDILALPGAALGRRCGREFTELLQHLRGERIAAVVHFEPPSCFQDSYPLGYPARSQDELGPALEQLLESLEHYLRQRQLQTRQLLWCFRGHGDYREELEVRASEAGTPRADWYRLTRLRLERQPFREEVDRVQLRVTQLDSAHPESGSLFRHARQNGSPGQLVDLLSNRLGSRAVSGLRCRDGHLPEDSYTTVAPGESLTGIEPTAAQRPFWLLAKPEALGTREEQLSFWGSRLTLIYGPERIEDGWWEGGTSRDYFIARNEQGQRFWLFHERKQRRWFLHGLFA
ncbi:MAG: DNA polymerase Y family protein [Halieaceae bacterium]|jgi:protein ImuB|nr:DNA polymerase Y family protein [Halieaceae bacterium]